MVTFLLASQVAPAGRRAKGMEESNREKGEGAERKKQSVIDSQQPPGVIGG